MNRENVFPFAASPRAALARRGAPDKSRAAWVKTDAECPQCAGPLRVETPVFVAGPDLFCETCETAFSVYRDEAAAD